MIILYLLLAIALVYLWPVRPWLRGRPQCAAFWARVDAIEARLFARSRTLALARWLQLVGWAASVDEFVRPVVVEVMPLLETAGIDWQSALPDKLKWIGPVLVATGLIFARLRKLTDGPVEAGSRP